MTLEQAIGIAAEAHAGQVDKGGSPYILHPIRVMMAMTAPEDRIAAILHDVVEDSPRHSLTALRDLEASGTVLDAVDALTRRKGETYEAFIARCGRNSIARRVKLADLRDNGDISRIRNPTEQDWERLLKYGRAATALLAMA